MKANFPENEDQRIKALNLYNILDTLPEHIFDDITKLASLICNTPISLISFIDRDRQWFKSTKGIDIKETHRDVSFCSHAILKTEETMIINDATSDNRFIDNELVTSELGIRFYAGTPLVTHDGYALGTLCVLDKKPKNLDKEQVEALEALSRQVMILLENKLDNIKLQSIEKDLEKEISKIKQLNKELLLSESRFKQLSETLKGDVDSSIEKLLEEKEKLISLINNAPAVISVLKGPDHVFDLVNPLYQEIFGDRKLLGKPIRVAQPELEGQGFYEILDGVYQTGKPYYGYGMPAQVNRDDKKHIFYYNFIYQPIFNNNKVEGIIVFAYDVTKEVISEEKYKVLSQSLEEKVQERTHDLYNAISEIDYERNKLNNLLMNAPAMIVILEDPDHIVKLSNYIFQKCTGNRDLINKPYREALPELEGQGFFEILDNIYQTGELFIGNEVSADLDVNGDGTLSRHYFNFIYQPTFDINQEVIGISIFAFDITEQVNARKEIEKLYNQVQISNESLQSFAYIASHDLQEPLRMINSYASLLSRRYKGKLDRSADEFISVIQDSSKRMKNLIDDVLTHSKIIKKGDSQNPINTNNVIEDVKSNLKLSFNESNAELNYKDLPNVSVEKIHLIQLFQNLISNAIKYRKKDVPLKINISAKKDNNKWLFSVNDNGIGISKENSEKVFEIFRRLHGREEYEGTGIGLANCKKIVELYDGKIWLEGEEGQGSTFFFTLPA